MLRKEIKPTAPTVVFSVTAMAARAQRLKQQQQDKVRELTQRFKLYFKKNNTYSFYEERGECNEVTNFFLFLTEVNFCSTGGLGVV